MKNKLFFWLERKVGGAILKLLRLSLKISLENANPKDQKCIYLFWHRNLIPLALHRIGEKLAIVVSASKDGELIAGPMKELGYVPVRGSTTRRGSEAMREMLRLSREMQLGITPDGPKGPSKSIQPGVLYIALLAGIPIIPMQAEIEHEWVFNSWDRFRVPKPFSRVRIKYGSPHWVKSKEDFEPVLASLKAEMDFLETELSFH